MFDGVFDYANPWIITVQDPEHPINSTVGALRWYVSYAVTDAICDSIQSGACFIALIMVLILTKPEKRATVVFIANVTALCSCFIGLLCNAIFYTTVNNDPLPSLAHVYFERPLPTGSVVDPVLSQLLIAVTVIAIEISLLKQAITVTKSTVEGPLRIPLFIFLVCVALAAIVVRLVFTVEMVIVQFDSGFPVHRKMEVATEVTFSISVVLVSIILVWKLSVTILTRRQLGITRSGPTQIIVVMFGQTMIVPGIISILQATVNLQARHLSITVTALYLPLTNLWASAAKAQPTMTSSQDDDLQRYWPAASKSPCGCRCHGSTGTMNKPRFAFSVPKKMEDSQDLDEMEMGMQPTSPLSQTFCQSETRHDSTSPSDIPDIVEHVSHKSVH